MKARLLATLPLLALFVACDKKSEDTQSPDTGNGVSDAADSARASAEAIKAEAGLAWLVASMDAKADPCSDFYQYACGGWIEATPLPPDKPRFSRSFSTIDQRNKQTLKGLLEKAAGGHRPDRAHELIGTYYAACMDTEAIASAGRAPLDPLLAEIDAIKNLDQLMAHAGKLHATVYGRVSWAGGGGKPVFFELGPESDFKNAPDMNILHMYQGGLGLPSRQLYLEEDEGSKQIRAFYVSHVAKMLALAGVPEADAQAIAPKILEFETKLARSSRPLEDLRDPDKIYNKLGFKGLTKKSKKVPWKAFFTAAGYPMNEQINVATPEFFVDLSKHLASTELPVLKAYMKYHVTQAMAGVMAPEFDQAAFALAQTTTGVQKQPERWERCVDATMWALPDALGKAYVDVAFAGASKSIADGMIGGINAAMESSFPNLSWMDDETRAKAKEKIAAMARKIGHPDEWKTYEGLELGASYAANTIAEKAWEHRRSLAKVGKPIDRNEWGMPAPLVNAYYNPTNNEIAFPAGIMQPPFFGEKLPAAMNYGGIGAVIGHELTHGFDDQGAKFDKTGKVEPWWTDAATKGFEERVACVVNQYSGFEPLPGVKVNGKLTAGENIADIGGMKEAYLAFMAATADAKSPLTGANGLTGEQVFFVAWAQNWCNVQSEQAQRRQVEVDPHSPGRYRAVGPLMNAPEFAQAFSCAEGTPMAPKDRCEVW